MDRRSEDPTFYKMLHQVLSDEMNGLDGELYQSVFDLKEQEPSLMNTSLHGC